MTHNCHVCVILQIGVRYNILGPAGTVFGAYLYLVPHIDFWAPLFSCWISAGTAVKSCTRHGCNWIGTRNWLHWCFARITLSTSERERRYLCCRRLCWYMKLWDQFLTDQLLLTCKIRIIRHFCKDTMMIFRACRSLHRYVYCNWNS